MTKNQIPKLFAALNVEETHSIGIWCLEFGIYLACDELSRVVFGA
jgi:hypothetical protein